MSGDIGDVGDLLRPQLLTDLIFGKPDQGVAAPVIQSIDKDLPVISSESREGAKKSVIRRSGRRKTLITRKNQLGAGDVRKATLLGG